VEGKQDLLLQQGSRQAEHVQYTKRNSRKMAHLGPREGSALAEAAQSQRGGKLIIICQRALGVGAVQQRKQVGLRWQTATRAPAASGQEQTALGACTCWRLGVCV
jgi:hypothetical protein